MKMNRIGFVPSWMEEEPVLERHGPAPDNKNEEKYECVVPEQLAGLRHKIAQIAVFMTTTAYSRMRKDERTRLIIEYTELLNIESGYSAAVSLAGRLGYE